MKKIISVVILALFFISCEEDVVLNSPSIQGKLDNVFCRATESEASLIVAQVAIRSQLKSELLSNHFTQVLRVQSQTRISQLTADWSIVGTKSRSALCQ